ncbi:hypothetical protein H2201_000926 [Coniosporium apollinis]|uniref:DUF3844 domain-containing protein n=1 Tax=Coniosporium apollinis TaxID=61459 RepID=A0ABQ9P634_9PEZI|nr:hypothetical protein H2201_000926 [Coniosporium apollinis]
MKLSISLAASALLSTAVARTSGPAGLVYTYDPADSHSHAASDPQSVTPETARLIFAQRAGLSHSYSLQDAGEREIQQINELGSPRQQLFGGEPEDEGRRIFVLVDGVQDMNDFFKNPPKGVKSFKIPDAPSAECNKRLYDEFESQAGSLPWAQDWRREDIIIPIDRMMIVSLNKEPVSLSHIATPGRITLMHFDSLRQMFKQYGANDAHYQDVLEHTRSYLTDVLAISQRVEIPITIALMPYGAKNNKCYGAPLTKSKRATPETPLSVKPATTLTSSIAHPDTSPIDTSSLLRGILPACFPSQSACEATTRNCTGHGSCRLAHKDRDSNNKACYACSCTPTIRKDKDGKNVKTTRWGGPACQKKDVVMPFWLLAGFTVLFLFVVSWGIGLLYSMGEQELPSVIGAGVSGPRAK